MSENEGSPGRGTEWEEPVNAANPKNETHEVQKTMICEFDLTKQIEQNPYSDLKGPKSPIFGGTRPQPNFTIQTK